MQTLLKNIGFAFVAVATTFGAFSMGIYGAVVYGPASQSAAVTKAEPATLNLDTKDLIATSAVLYDLRTSRVLYQKDAYRTLPLASLTKLMASEVVLSLRSPDTPIEITSKDLLPYGDWNLKVGDTIRLGDLIELALVASSNDAIEAAINSLGEHPIERMNTAAAALGLTHTRFSNASGLDVNASEAGAYGSTYDIARLAALFYKDHADFFEMTTRAEATIIQRDGTITAESTTVPLQSIPGFVGAKTGYTELAGGNLVAVFDLEPGHTVVVAVLGSTKEGRFEDVKKIINAARESL